MAAGGERGSASPPAAGVLDELSGALASARVALSGFLGLLALEARRAGLALVWMGACGLLAAICFAAAWLGLMAVAALCMTYLGLPPVAALLAVVLANLAAAAVLIRVCISSSRDLLFAATRRQLDGKPPGAPAE